MLTLESVFIDDWLSLPSGQVVQVVKFDGCDTPDVVLRYMNNPGEPENFSVTQSWLMHYAKVFEIGA